MSIVEPVRVDHDRGEVRVFGKPVRVAPNQYKIIRALVSADGKIVSRETLLKSMRSGGSSLDADVRAVDQGVCKTRRLLGRAAKYLVTVSGRGYRWSVK